MGGGDLAAWRRQLSIRKATLEGTNAARRFGDTMLGWSPLHTPAQPPTMVDKASAAAIGRLIDQIDPLMPKKIQAATKRGPQRPARAIPKAAVEGGQPTGTMVDRRRDETLDLLLGKIDDLVESNRAAVGAMRESTEQRALPPNPAVSHGDNQ